jgi:hypothetical protein
MATRFRSDAQKFTHDNYNAAVTAAKKTLPAGCTSLLIDNTDGSISVLVSFDGGTKYKTIIALARLSLDVDGLQSYYIKSASGTPAVECLYGSEA